MNWQEVFHRSTFPRLSPCFPGSQNVALPVSLSLNNKFPTGILQRRGGNAAVPGAGHPQPRVSHPQGIQTSWEDALPSFLIYPCGIPREPKPEREPASGISWEIICAPNPKGRTEVSRLPQSHSCLRWDHGRRQHRRAEIAAWGWPDSRGSRAPFSVIPRMMVLPFAPGLLGIHRDRALPSPRDPGRERGNVRP